MYREGEGVGGGGGWEVEAQGLFPPGLAGPLGEGSLARMLTECFYSMNQGQVERILRAVWLLQVPSFLLLRHSPGSYTPGISCLDCDAVVHSLCIQLSDEKCHMQCMTDNN